jgi:transcriptional regulator with XRE-family HTH domain
MENEARMHPSMSKKKPDAMDVAVGQHIKVERLGRGISQGALAQQLGITFQQVQKYENGVNRVGAGRLSRIAHVLGVPGSLFFGSRDHGRAESAQSPLALLSTPGAIRLLRAYASARSPELRKSVIALLEEVLKKG